MTTTLLSEEGYSDKVINKRKILINSSIEILIKLVPIVVSES